VRAVNHLAALLSVAFVLCGKQASAHVPTGRPDDSEATTWVKALGGRVSKDCTSISLRRTEVTDVSSLTNQTNVERLDLSHTSVTDISALANLTNLRMLWLHTTRITNASSLTNLTKLQELWLNDTRITDLSRFCPGR